MVVSNVSFYSFDFFANLMRGSLTFTSCFKLFGILLSPIL